MNEEGNLIEEQFSKLPKNFQAAIKAVPWKSRVNEISLLKTLSLEKVEAVERETMFIIYGFEAPEDYIQNMAREAEIDEDTAVAIAEIVNEKIFKEISDRAKEEEKKISMTTQESKEDAMRRLSQRMGNAPMVPEIMPKNLPMVEKGEVAHTVPHIEQPVTPAVIPTVAPATPSQVTTVSNTPEPKPEIKAEIKPEAKHEPSKPAHNPHYPTGKDPYRESLV